MIVKQQSFGVFVVKLTEVNGNYRAQITTSGAGLQTAADGQKARVLYAKWLQEARALEDNWRQRQKELNASRVAAPPKKQVPTTAKTQSVATPKVAPVPVVTAAQLQNSVEPLKNEIRDVKNQLNSLEAWRRSEARSKETMQAEINRLNARLDDLVNVLTGRQ